MARRRRTKTGRFTSGGSSIRVVRTPAPIVRVSAPRAAPRRRRRHSGRRRSSVGGFGIGSHPVQMAMGGALFGFAVKSGLVAKLPPIPVIGRVGAAALLLDYWGKHGGGDIVRKCGTAAAVIAGYQLGSTGSISGDDTMGMDTMGDSYAEGDYTEGDELQGDELQGDELQGDQE